LAKDDNNFISKSDVYSKGLIVSMGSKEIFKQKSNREYLKFDEAIHSLIDKKIIYDLRNEGRVFELTDFGRNFIREFDNF